jgi:two-component system OmpR family response regulator
MKKILIIEDDLNLGVPLSGALEMSDYEVLHLSTGDKALENMRVFKPDIIILDIMLNGKLDGFEIGKLIRKEKDTPILFTTSLNGNDDLKQGFSLINTDYVRKPYKFMEVMLRLDNLLNTYNKTKKAEEEFHIGHFSFLPEERSLKYECEKIQLTNHETGVLMFLCKNLNVFVDKKSIIKEVWNDNNVKQKEASLNNILSNLRKYLQTDNSIEMESIKGFGVRLVKK